MPQSDRPPGVARAPRRPHRPLRLLPALISTAVLAAVPAAQAQLFKEPALQAMYAAERAADLTQAATPRLASRTDDGQAVLALAMAALMQDEPARREAAIARADACVAKAPQTIECQYALGTVLGVHAVSQGLMAMAGAAGKVKEALSEAHRLAPDWYPARSALVEFYLVAPGLMGGSTSRATALASGAPRPEQARALQARVQLQAGQPEAALALLADVVPGADSALAEDQRSWQAQAGFALLRAQQPAKARPVFERLVQARPNEVEAVYGLARALHDGGAPAEALPLYEQALRSPKARQHPVLDYQFGLALQALGRRDEARTALQRFVSGGRGPSKALDDARKRLAELAG